MKKRIYGIVLTCALAFAMVGCGSETENTGETTTAAQSTEASAGSSDSVDFRGSVNGTTYTNPYLNITFTAPDSDWMFSDAADLAQRVGKTGEQLSAYTLSDISGGKVFPAMMCTNMKTGESTSLILSAYDTTKDEKTMIEELSTQMEQQFSSSGTSLKCEVKEGSSFGIKYYIDISYDQSGVTLYMRQFYFFKDGVAASITVTAFSDENRTKLCNGWK